jgi:hypothetical protein
MQLSVRRIVSSPLLRQLGQLQEIERESSEPGPTSPRRAEIAPQDGGDAPGLDLFNDLV